MALVDSPFFDGTLQFAHFGMVLSKTLSTRPSFCTMGMTNNLHIFEDLTKDKSIWRLQVRDIDHELLSLQCLLFVPCDCRGMVWVFGLPYWYLSS